MERKIRDVGSEAPAIRVKMNNGETKVIGMMAPKVQVHITMPSSKDLSEALENILEKHSKKSLITLISTETLKNIDKIDSSCDFEQYCQKMGLLNEDSTFQKAIFIINKEGEIVYKEIVSNLEDEFDLKNFDKKLEETIKFKKKGHTHENWMGV